MPQHGHIRSGIDSEDVALDMVRGILAKVRDGIRWGKNVTSIIHPKGI